MNGSVRAEKKTVVARKQYENKKSVENWINFFMMIFNWT